MPQKLYKIGVGFGVILLKDGKILLGLRNSDALKADSALHGEGTWCLPGGKLDYKETFIDGAVREVLEETGIKINKDKVKIVRLGSDIVNDAHFVTAGFICESFTGEPKIMEPDEIIKWQWYHQNNLPSIMYPASLKVINAWKSNIIWEQNYG